MNATVDFGKELMNVQTELYRFAIKLTADREEANDLVQETALRVLESTDKFTAGTNFKGWVCTVMHHLFVNNYRRIVREQTYIDPTENAAFLNQSQESGFTTADGALDLKEMHRIVNALPDDFRKPFTMFAAGFKYREICDQLNMPMGTVK
ncbi:MAG: RNA polymerase sigma factor, partial [Prevotellaceae bacterium]|nr:RNA polymerase sigma factor [Prevotellaceae bacterium]